MVANVFIHGGRIGDTVYALYAVKKLGGGIFQQCLRHAPLRWNQELLEATLKLVRFQSYVNEARFVKVPIQYVMDHGQHIYQKYSFEKNTFLGSGEEAIPWTHSFIDSESENDPYNYPDLIGKNWLHYAHQARRHCHYFNLKWNPDDSWLEWPAKTKSVDIVFHAPSYRLVRSKRDWECILKSLMKKFNVVILSGHEDKHEWMNVGDVTVADDFLDVSKYLSSAYCFLGCASSVYAIAEGMKQYRFVELADDCFNNYPYGKSGRLINKWSNEEIVGHVEAFIHQRKR